MYGITICVAILIAALFAESRLSSKQEKDLMWKGLLWIIFFGIIGARIYHVIDFWEVYSSYPLQIFAIWKGGLGIIGAIIGGIIGALIFCKKHNQNILKWLDLAGLAMPLAQAIGRWANFFNNEHMPYAIYESVANAALFLVLFAASSKTKLLQKTGTTFALYLVGYGLIRLLLEPFRTSPWIVSNINVAQIFSLAFVACGLGLLIKVKLNK